MSDNKILLGEGSYGKVFKLLPTSSSDPINPVVYKEIKLWAYESPNSKNFIILENNLKELIFYKILFLYYKSNYSNFSISFLLNTKFPNIPIPSKVSFKKNFGYIHFDDYGTVLSESKFKSNQQFFNIFKQICSTVNSFFDSNISHGDLKPTNILVKETEDPENPQVTIVDFGSLCFFHNTNLINRYQRCTIVYTSPEELCQIKYSMANDWWSVGVIMFEFLSEKSFVPCFLLYSKYDDKTVQQFINHVFNNKKSPDFNAKSFLIQFFQNISQFHLNKFIDHYISNKDFANIIKLLLTLDNFNRIDNVKEVVSYFECHLQYNQYENMGNFQLKKYKEIEYPGYSNKERKGFVDILFYACQNNKYKKINLEIFGHAVMMLDRFFVKIYGDKKLELVKLDIISVLCLCLSSIILKGEFFKSNEIIYIIEDIYEIKYGSEDIENALTILLNVLNLALFNLSPDLLINSNIDYKLIYDVFSEYILLNETCLAIYEKLAS